MNVSLSTVNTSNYLMDSLQVLVICEVLFLRFPVSASAVSGKLLEPTLHGWAECGSVIQNEKELLFCKRSPADLSLWRSCHSREGWWVSRGVSLVEKSHQISWD